jgi:hypothetical protein
MSVDAKSAHQNGAGKAKKNQHRLIGALNTAALADAEDREVLIWLEMQTD